MWLSEKLEISDSEKVTCPFFVLLDFRIMCSHLLSKEKKQEILQSLCERLRMEKHPNDYEELYDKLLDQMLDSYSEILDQINRRYRIANNGVNTDGKQRSGL